MKRKVAAFRLHKNHPVISNICCVKYPLSPYILLSNTLDQSIARKWYEMTESKLCIKKNLIIHSLV